MEHCKTFFVGSLTNSFEKTITNTTQNQTFHSLDPRVLFLYKELLDREIRDAQLLLKNASMLMMEVMILNNGYDEIFSTFLSKFAVDESREMDSSLDHLLDFASKRGLSPRTNNLPEDDLYNSALNRLTVPTRTNVQLRELIHDNIVDGVYPNTLAPLIISSKLKQEVRTHFKKDLYNTTVLSY